MTGKKTSTAAIIILDSGLSTPNQLFMIGAKAMIGIALARDGERQQRRPARSPSGPSANADDDARSVADDEPADRLEKRVAGADAERPAAGRPVLDQRARRSPTARQDERPQVERRTTSSQSSDHADEHDDRRAA